MKRFLLQAAFFCMVCLCYAQHEELGGHKSSDAVQASAVNMAAAVSEENGGAAQQEHADVQNEDTGTQIERNDTVLSAEAAKPAPQKKESFFLDGRTAFALGIEASGAVANSLFLFTDLSGLLSGGMDFRQLSGLLSKENISVAEAAKLKLYLDIYLQQKYEFGLYAGVDTLAFASLPKTFMGLAAGFMGGKLPDGTGEGDLFARALAFADIGVFYGMSIKALKFRVNASYYAPFFYLDPHLGSYTADNLSVSSNVHINAYTPLDFGSGMGNVLKWGGFDLDFIGSYTFNPYVSLQFSALHIPIVPAFMDKGYSVAYSLGMTGMDTVADGAAKGPNADLPKKAVLRPLKIGAGADIYPFANKYLIISPSVALQCLEPFYVDGGLKLESRFLKVFGVYYAMAREDRIWKNRLGYFMDTRIFRLETFIAVAGTTFLSSFRLKGTEAGIKLVFGY